jgi:hypothetical protein
LFLQEQTKDIIIKRALIEAQEEEEDDIENVNDWTLAKFEEWDPTKDADDSQSPATMIINSSELRGAGFNLQEGIPPELESVERLGRRTRGAGLRQLEGVGRKRFVLSSDDDNELRSRCE